MEWGFLLVLLALASLGLTCLRRRGRLGIVLFGVLLAAIGLVAVDHGRSLSRHSPADEELTQALPRRVADRHFVTSESCQSCHPQEHASWHASYHRQMTQVARPESVLGSFDNVRIEADGHVHRLSRRGDELWIDSTSDTPSGAEGAHTTDTPPNADAAGARRVVMTTGAHHMQLFWMPGNKGNLLDEVPLVFIRDENPQDSRWAPLEASYLAETPAGFHLETHWNTSCLLCHSTGGNPRVDGYTGATDTTVAELGIACESCHGPGEEHVRLHRDRRDRSRVPSDLSLAPRQAEGGAEAETLDQRIVNPARLGPTRSAQVCGFCHAVASFLNDQLIEDFFLSGSQFRPGDDLMQTRVTVLPALLSDEEKDKIRKINPFFDGSFWPDGMVRITGREYNGLVESTCYQQGGMTCLSCHSMHDSDPDDQLALGMEGNEACYQCHQNYRGTLTAHTHHAAESSGSRCYNCHMPHTTYGLFKGIRSHRISSPSARTSQEIGRPNACNLCHLDQTLGWTAEKLSDWYGHPILDAEDDEQHISAALLWLLKGDSIQRVLLAWGAGWAPAVEASGGAWLIPHVAQLLTDESPVIRLVAYRSLRRLAPRLVQGYDFIAPEAKRAAMRDRAIEAWKLFPLDDRRGAGPRVLISSDGQLRLETIERLLRDRDQRQLQVQE